MSAPRPYVTDPFHPLSTISNMQSFQYIYQSLPGFSSKWYLKLFLSTVGIWQLRMCFSKPLSASKADNPKFRPSDRFETKVQIPVAKQ